MIREEAIKFIDAIKRGLKSTGKDYPYRDAYIPKMKEACEMAIHALEHEPRWIPISERLPNKDDEVLVTMIYGDVTTATRYNDKDEWFVDSDSNNAGTDEILAWMPKPESYKAESEE